ncbi:MAG TPA: hypothetical protein VM510_12895 [Caulifigura sp.]|nr:hypothetical protein [Caulifigura sp.]
MSADLAYRLKDHLYKMLFDNLRNEIDYRVEDLWGKHFDHLLAAHDTAAQNLQDALQKAQRLQQEHERRHERIVAVFNLFSGMALGWLSAHLQYRCAVNYFRRTDYLPNWSDAEKLYVIDVVESEDKVAGKMFGDTLGRDLVGSLVKLGASVPKGPSEYKAPNASAIMDAKTLEQMRTKMRDEMRSQKNQAKGTVEELTNQIQRDTEIGERLVRALYNDVPGIDKQPIGIQEARGQESINRWLNNERKVWAKRWLYYANDPPKVDDWTIKRHIERELWVLWIMENRKSIRNSMTDIIAERVKWFDSIIDHINALGEIPVTDVIKKRGKNRDPEIERLILWCWRRKPVRPTWKSEGTERTLTPIETFTRPHSSAA